MAQEMTVRVEGPKTTWLYMGLEIATSIVQGDGTAWQVFRASDEVAQISQCARYLKVVDLQSGLAAQKAADLIFRDYLDLGY